MLPQRGVVAVTGYDEGVEVFLDNARFSSFNSSYGAHPLPFEPASCHMNSSFSPNLFVVKRDLASYPNIRGYLQRIGECGAYQRAMKKAEPDVTPLLT